MNWNGFFALMLCLSVVQIVDRLNKIEAAQRNTPTQTTNNTVQKVGL